ncbi:LuxR C-terminal-related transcriptional regulator [Clostridium sp.]|jgi:DNA-binding CsgD family transcriptional regulator|uniref:LuxR C-terminal-related transcriptional regulator n=1 Tax=Clostridium sp. TaxID=1506 RepID=UPI00283BE1DD|nr:LuxR C-terminal-related transcriptional regulator [Clostridium sp.]MDR3596163.1 LuxR C-terminal-related transcriptional regulator [Clostridium sp.]
MQNNEFLLINNIIYQIYSIPDFDTMKITFLNLLKMLIPNTASSILMADHTNSKNLVCDPICVPEVYSDTEKNYLLNEDEDYTRWVMLSGQCLLIRESDLMPEEERIKTTLYKKCYEPFGLHYSLQLNLVYNDLFLGVITIYRKKEERDFSSDEMFIIKAFSDHLNLRFYEYYTKDSKNSSSTSYSLANLASQYNLTNREVEVLQLIFQDMDNDQIADKLFISGYTLKKHIQNLYRKFNVSTKWNLLKFRDK